VQYAAIWSFIFIGAIVAVGLWTDIRQTVAPRQSVMMDGARVEVPRHRRPLLPDAGVNGAPIRFVVDTGATDLVLTRADAERAGSTPTALIFRGRPSPPTEWCRPRRSCWRPWRWGARTAGSGGRERGEMQESLLGMSYLQRFDRLEISGGRLVLER
jgi:aspartyl protease family protein